MNAPTKQQPSQVHQSVPAEVLAMVTASLQQREQLAAVHLLVSGYRPLAFVMQQSLHFMAPLALLLGVSLEHLTTKQAEESSSPATPEVER